MIWWFKKLQIILIVIGRHVKRNKETTSIHLLGQKGRDDLMILALVYTSRSPSINAINAHPCLFSLISASTSSSISRKSAFGCPIRAFQGKLLALVYASHTLINALKAHPWFFSLLSPSTSISFGCPFSTLNTVWLKSWQEVVLYIISNCTVLELKMNSIAQALANKCTLFGY